MKSYKEATSSLKNAEQWIIAISLAIVSGLLLQSCDKLNIDQNKFIDKQGINSPRSILSGVLGIEEVTVEDGMLKFYDVHHFNSVKNELNRATENWDEAFALTLTGMTEDEVFEYERSLEYDPEFPLSEFEDKFDFFSLRRKYNNLERTFLSNSTPDWIITLWHLLMSHPLEHYIMNGGRF